MCLLQARDPGNWVVQFQSESKGLRNRGADDVSPSPRVREDQCPSSGRQAGRKRGEFLLSLPFCSVQALNGLNDTHTHWGSPSTLQSPPTQMLISSGNTLTDTPRNNI